MRPGQCCDRSDDEEQRDEPAGNAVGNSRGVRTQFGGALDQPDDSREARRIAGELLPRGDVAAFNQAMLDLGAQFCRSTPLCSSCPVRRACRWILEGGEDPAPGSAGVSRPQSRFEGSDRQVRGRIIAVLREGPTGERRLAGACRDVEPQRLATILSGLVGEGLVEMAGRSVRLATT